MSITKYSDRVSIHRNNVTLPEFPYSATERIQFHTFDCELDQNVQKYFFYVYATYKNSVDRFQFSERFLIKTASTSEFNTGLLASTFNEGHMAIYQQIGEHGRKKINATKNNLPDPVLPVVEVGKKQEDVFSGDLMKDISTIATETDIEDELS